MMEFDEIPRSAPRSIYLHMKHSKAVNKHKWSRTVISLLSSNTIPGATSGISAAVTSELKLNSSKCARKWSRRNGDSKLTSVHKAESASSCIWTSASLSGIPWWFPDYWQAPSHSHRAASQLHHSPSQRGRNGGRSSVIWHCLHQGHLRPLDIRSCWKAFFLTDTIIQLFPRRFHTTVLTRLHHAMSPRGWFLEFLARPASWAQGVFADRVTRLDTDWCYGVAPYYQSPEKKATRQKCMKIWRWK